MRYCTLLVVLAAAVAAPAQSADLKYKQRLLATASGSATTRT